MRDLGVVGGDDPECLGGELRPQLGAHGVMPLQLADELAVVLRAADGGDTGCVAGGRPKQRRPTDVDHLDRLVDPDELCPHRGGERRDVDDDDVDGSDPRGRQLLHLLVHVAAGEDAGIDRRVERLDLAPDQRLDAGEVRDGADLDPVRGEMIPRPVGCIDLDVEGEEVPGKGRDPVAVGNRQQGSHPGSARPRWLRPSIPRAVAYSEAGERPCDGPRGARLHGVP